jgi:hypothetical protein
MTKQTATKHDVNITASTWNALPMSRSLRGVTENEIEQEITGMAYQANTPHNRALHAYVYDLNHAELTRVTVTVLRAQDGSICEVSFFRCMA